MTRDRVGCAWLFGELEFRLVPVGAFLVWLAQGWRLAPRAWDAAHHLDHSVPVWRPA